MKAVTLTASSYNELKSLFLIRNLYIPTDVKITPTQYSEICKRFVKGYEKLHDNEEITKAMKEVNEYTAELEKLGVRDRIVRSSDFNYSYIVKRSLSAFFLCLLFLILSLPSLIMLSPFAYIIKNKAESERIAVSLFLLKKFLIKKNLIFLRQRKKIQIKLKPKMSYPV